MLHRRAVARRRPPQHATPHVFHVEARRQAPISRRTETAPRAPDPLPRGPRRSLARWAVGSVAALRVVSAGRMTRLRSYSSPWWFVVFLVAGASGACVTFLIG